MPPLEPFVLLTLCLRSGGAIVFVLGGADGPAPAQHLAALGALSHRGAAVTADAVLHFLVILFRATPKPVCEE